MTKKSTLRFGGVMSAAFLAIVAVPAHATKWMIIGPELNPAPNRSVYIMSAGKECVFERFVDGFDKINTDRSPHLAATFAAF